MPASWPASYRVSVRLPHASVYLHLQVSLSYSICFIYIIENPSWDTNTQLSWVTVSILECIFNQKRPVQKLTFDLTFLYQQLISAFPSLISIVTVYECVWGHGTPVPLVF